MTAAARLRPASVLRLQRSAGNRVTAALVAIQRQPKQQPADPVERAGTVLRGFESWVTDEQQRQHVVDTGAVVGLDPKQAANLKDAAARLAAALPGMAKLGQAVGPAVDSLRQAVTYAEQAQTASRSRDQIDRLEAQHLLNQSHDAVVEAQSRLARVGGVDVTVPAKNLKLIGDALASSGSVADVVRSLKAVIDLLTKLRDATKARADSTQRIEILLRAFVALNDPGFARAPTAKEINSVKSLLAGGLGDEFVAVFGTAVDFDTLVQFANTLGQQIEARDRMTSATGKKPLTIPGQADAQEYFAALAAKDNADVFAAYENFAGGFFYHRHLAAPSDLLIDVSDLFAAAASITGKRGLVCTGYATIGALAMTRAGATLTGYSVGVHASDDMVRNDQLDEQGHAVARMTRKGQVFSVSNDRIVAVKNALVGPGAVEWGTRSNPLFVGDGKTMTEAVNAMMAKIADRKRRLPRK